jgi:hypothetical protein
MKFRPEHYAVIAFIVGVVIYMLYRWRKSREHKEEHKEGTFEKLLRTMKNISKISIYRDNNTISFPSEDMNKLINEWLENFVKDYCNKKNTVKLPTEITLELEKVINLGMFYTIFNSDKSLDRKKDDIATLTLIFPLFLIPTEQELPYKIIDNNTVEIIKQETKVSFEELKNDIYDSILGIYKQNNEGRQRFLVKYKQNNQEPITDDEIYKIYNEMNQQYKNTSQVYCQNI